MSSKIQVGVHFTLGEFTRSETATKENIRNVPNEAQILNIITLVKEVLDPLRREMGFPIKITSGFRSVELNAKVGGRPNSFHLRGLAADLIPGGNPSPSIFSKRMDQIESWLSSYNPDLIYWKRYEDRNFFHVHLKKSKVNR